MEIGVVVTHFFIEFQMWVTQVWSKPNYLEHFYKKKMDFFLFKKEALSQISERKIINLVMDSPFNIALINLKIREEYEI